MTDVNSTYTSLKDAINIGLSCLGETPVSAPDNTSTNVVLAKQIIEEVSRDVQSKGWWFNTSGSDISILGNSGSGAAENFASTGGTNNAGIPEEARRYIAIRAARVLQSRFVGSEELLKFSFQEEQVSLAILTQAHVRNAGGSTSFNSFPADLKGMGVEEVLFLQQSAEEKLLSLRLVTELKSGDKLAAETALIGDQEDLVEQQVLTEVQETAKRGAEKDLVDAQKSQIQTETVLKSQQALTELQNTNLVTQTAIKTAAEAGVVTSQQALIAQQVLDVVADTELKTKQGTKIDEEVDLLQTQDLLTDAQKATELQNAIKVAAEAGLVTSQQALVAQQVLDTVADTAIKEEQKLKIYEEKLLVTEQKTLVTKQALTEVQNAIKISADTGLVTSQQALVSQQVLDAAADVALKGKQGSLVDAQASTEAQNAIKVAADAGLVTTQQALIAQQILESVANVSNITADVALKGKQGIKLDADTGLTTQQQALTAQQTLDVVADTALKGKQSLAIEADTDLKTSQKTQLDAQTAIEATAEKAFYDGVIAGTQSTYRDFAAELRIMGVQESMFQQTPAVKKVELLADALKLRWATATEASPASNLTTTEISEVNKVMRFIGESPVSALNSNSLASECVRLLRDTDKELQGRGWWFNTEEDVELTPASATNTIVVPNTILSLEANDYDVRIQKIIALNFLYDLSKQSYQDWTSPIKCKVVYQRSLDDTPQKYREYLSVRVAILLTELYPKSGIDIQRLPKMEAELRAYFKDREADEANYSVFDNYDTASRIGINRNYDLS
jgi:hypothetical protein